MSISPSLSYRSCAAAFPTGYGPRGDAFAVDHIVGNVDSAHCHAKGNIDSGPTVAIKYKLSACTLIWLFGMYILMLWLMDGFVNLSVHRYELIKSSCKTQGRRVP